MNEISRNGGPLSLSHLPKNAGKIAATYWGVRYPFKVCFSRDISFLTIFPFKWRKQLGQGRAAVVFCFFFSRRLKSQRSQASRTQLHTYYLLCCRRRDFRFILEGSAYTKERHSMYFLLNQFSSDRYKQEKRDEGKTQSFLLWAHAQSSEWDTTDTSVVLWYSTVSITKWQTFLTHHISCFSRILFQK